MHLGLSIPVKRVFFLRTLQNLAERVEISSSFSPVCQSGTLKWASRTAVKQLGVYVNLLMKISTIHRIRDPAKWSSDFHCK